LVFRLADTQQHPAAATVEAAVEASFFCSKQPTNQPINQSNSHPPSGSLKFSGKQGGGATVLMEGFDIVTRETCSLSECKQLREKQLCCILLLPPSAKLSLPI
jgi:hypothetical protein